MIARFRPSLLAACALAGPGETKTIAFTVPATALRRWNEAEMTYSTPAGDWTLAAGASSADLRQTSTVKL